MAAFVLDSSVTLAWYLPDESGSASAALLERAAAEGVAVPGLWPLEIANALLMAERRGRIAAAARVRALGALRRLPISVDSETAERAWADALTLATAHRLSVYDAAYLELAVRRRLPLATFDRDLRAAASALDLDFLQ